jgi:hypothetical protein
MCFRNIIPENTAPTTSFPLLLYRTEKERLSFLAMGRNATLRESLSHNKRMVSTACLFIISAAALFSVQRPFTESVSVGDVDFAGYSLWYTSQGIIDTPSRK